MMQTWLKDELNRHCCVWLNVGWMGWKNTSMDICVCKRMWNFQSFNFIHPGKQNSRYLYVCFPVLDTCEYRMVHACFVNCKIFLKIRPYNNISDVIYFLFRWLYVLFSSHFYDLKLWTSGILCISGRGGD